MRTITIFAAAFLAAASFCGTAFATDYTKGVVKKINVKDGKVTIIHEELTNLDMPAMTMVFRVADPAMLEKLTEGQEIEFVADRINGKITVTELK